MTCNTRQRLFKGSTGLILMSLSRIPLFRKPFLAQLDRNICVHAATFRLMT